MRTGPASQDIAAGDAGPPEPGPGAAGPRAVGATGPRAVGATARAGRAAALDTWLAGLLPAWPEGVALVAVGGLGRRECAPRADVDLVLVHDGHPGIGTIADALWYPVWDAKIGLDHSVRTLPEALSVAHDDVKVGLALLDARHVAGDATLADRLRRSALDLWRRTAARGLPALRELAEARWQAHGELAFLLEGDVKEARGGLRDVGLLRGIGVAGVADAARPTVRAAHLRLLDVRDALHVATGRRVDRLVAQECATVAGLLRGLSVPQARAESPESPESPESREPPERAPTDRDALLRRVATDARTVAYAMDDAWRAVDRWLAERRRGGARRDGADGRRHGADGRRPIGRDVVAQDGEAVLARAAVAPRPDPGLAPRVAAAAATVRLPIARSTLEWLARFSVPMPAPWPAGAREAFLTLLSAGPGLVQAWEACDRYGLVATWLPEWTRVRSLPQHNPVHIYTVDRHLVQTAAEVAAFVRQVSRPDLLVLAALLHDIGKGLPGDHSEAGAPVAAAVARRMGLAPADVTTIERLVRLHLLLPETATRRDISDPVTVTTVARAVGDVPTLDLLYGIARADAAATGPAAWSAWKGRLVAELVERVRSVLDTGAAPAPPPPDPSLVAGPLPAVRIEGDLVYVAAADRRGLLAAVAGCLALHRLEVVTADVSTVEGRALVRCAVQPRYGTPPQPEALSVDLRRAALGELPGLARLGARTPDRGATGVGPRAMWHRDAATDAAVLELRAADAPGLLYRVSRALEDAGADVRAARISTLGGAAVDAFYLVGAWSEEDSRVAVERAVLGAAG
jgi:[protein-PII] uridylyltransferase